jgi:CRISPR-associated protein Cas5 subtype I-B
MNTSPDNGRATLPALMLRISGRWAHFKKPETNNNPLTHDFITKTALLGLIGAVLGVERQQMRALFPQWSEDLLYGVQVLGTVKKESWSFTMREVANQNNKAPRPMELLKSPDFLVALASRNGRSDEALQRFASFVEKSFACYTPVLGLHNCAAELEFRGTGEFIPQSGAYTTKGFAPRSHNLDKERIDFNDFRLGLESIPTHQNNDFWNNPKNYVEVCYTDEDREIALQNGEYFQFSNGTAWNLV